MLFNSLIVTKITDVETDEEMSMILTRGRANENKVYRFVGKNSSTYAYGNLYVVVLGETPFEYFTFTPIENNTAYSIKLANVNNIPSEGEVIVPSTYEGLPVVKIDNDAFSGCSGLTSVTIPDSVTSIGGSAFSSCSGLTSVTIGNGVIRIGSHAFLNCDSLTSVIIGNSVTYIDESAFESCIGLISITIPDSVKSISYNAFRDCYKLIEVCNNSTLDISVGSSDNGCVGYYAKNVYTSTSGQSKLSNIDGYIIYTDGTNKILVAYLGNETQLVLPEGIPLYRYAFVNNKNITNITIPNSVTSIGNGAFKGCNNLTDMTISFIGASSTPADYESYLGYEAVFGYIFGYEIRDSSDIISGATYQYNNGNKYYHYYIPASLKSVTISNSITSIGESAFKNCNKLTDITIPDSVTIIHPDAFCSCSRLTSIIIGNGVTNITARVFIYCGGLTNVYYKGTAAEWSRVFINSEGNDNLKNATRYYYSATQPTTSGNYWHYVEGLPTAWGTDTEQDVIQEGTVLTINNATAKVSTNNSNEVIIE